MNIRFPDVHFAEENLAKAVDIILARVEGHVVATLIEDLHENRKPYYLGPGSENCHYLHKTRGEAAFSIRTRIGLFRPTTTPTVHAAARRSCCHPWMSTP